MIFSRVWCLGRSFHRFWPIASHSCFKPCQCNKCCNSKSQVSLAASSVKRMGFASITWRALVRDHTHRAPPWSRWTLVCLHAANYSLWSSPMTASIMHDGDVNSNEGLQFFLQTQQPSGSWTTRSFWRELLWRQSPKQGRNWNQSAPYCAQWRIACGQKSSRQDILPKEHETEHVLALAMSWQHGQQKLLFTQQSPSDFSDLKALCMSRLNFRSWVLIGSPTSPKTPCSKKSASKLLIKSRAVPRKSTCMRSCRHVSTLHPGTWCHGDTLAHVLM